MSCFLDTGLGNLWEVPMAGYRIYLQNVYADVVELFMFMLLPHIMESA
jgi:hypothetical protein